jgi:hypothetical protein
MLFFLLLYTALAACVGMMAMIRGRPGRAWFIRAIVFTPFICGPLVVVLPREGGAFLASEEIEDDWLLSDAAPAVADATIRIVRHDAVAGPDTPYEIFINNAREGAVAPAAVADFKVPHGVVLVEARTDWGGSTPLTVDIAAGDRIDIQVSNRPAGRLFGFWPRLFGADEYLALRPLAAAHPPGRLAPVEA